MKTIIWDLDGVLYPFDDAYYANDFATEAKIMTRRGLADWNTAYAMAAKSQELYGGSYEIFMYEFGLDFDDLDKEFTETFAAGNFLKPDSKLISAFEKNRLGNILYSHGRHPWIARVLDQRGLSRFFKQDMIFSKYDFKQGEKSRYADGFLKIMELTGTKPTDAYMVENEENNLRVPSELGMKPILIMGQTQYHKPPTKDFKGKVFYSPQAFLKSISGRCQ